MGWFTVYVHYPKTLVTIFIIIPRIFMATLFAIEVMYFHKIDYFYTCFPILLLPFLFRGIYELCCWTYDVQICR